VTVTVDPLGRTEICGVVNVKLPLPLRPIVPLVSVAVARAVSVPDVIPTTGVEVIAIVDPSELVVAMTVMVSVEPPLIPRDELTIKFMRPTVMLQ
jgi:hypothetical protein